MLSLSVCRFELTSWKYQSSPSSSISPILTVDWHSFWNLLSSNFLRHPSVTLLAFSRGENQTLALVFIYPPSFLAPLVLSLQHPAGSYLIFSKGCRVPSIPYPYLPSLFFFFYSKSDSKIRTQQLTPELWINTVNRSLRVCRDTLLMCISSLSTGGNGDCRGAWRSMCPGIEVL